MGRARDVRGIGQERRILVVSVSVIFIKDAWGARQVGLWEGDLAFLGLLFRLFAMMVGWWG